MKKLFLVTLTFLLGKCSYAITPQYQQLLNSGSKAMNVNGGSPVTFSYSPGTGTIRVTDIMVLLKDEGTNSFSNFGALAGLTNGVLIRWSIGGSTKTFATIKDNATLTNVFPDHQHFGSSAVLSILSVVTPVGFGNSNNVFKGKFHFPNAIDLTDSDAIQALVQDNLTNIDTLEMGVYIETE